MTSILMATFTVAPDRVTLSEDKQFNKEAKIRLRFSAD